MGALAMQPATYPLAERGAVLSVEQRRRLANDVARLRFAYGSNWPRFPCGFTVRATQAGDVLASGVMPIEVADAEPAPVIHQLRDFSRDIVDLSARLQGPVAIVGEVFGTDLSTMSLGELLQLCRGIARLAKAPPPTPTWAHPGEAYAARILLLALGDELRELSALRRKLYQEFSEDIWSLRAAQRTPSVERWWQSTRRRRIRRQLTTVTRTGNPPADVKTAMATLRRTNELRADIDSMWSAISRRLGHFAAEGIPDIDGAMESLDAFDGVVAALGHRVDTTVLHDLAVADVFVCDELTVPANDIELIVSVWAANAKRTNAATPLAHSTPQLDDWVAQTKEALDVLAYLRDATPRSRNGTRTVGELFEDAIVRDRVQDLCGSVQ
jgi:hypothetical protein